MKHHVLLLAAAAAQMASACPVAHRPSQPNAAVPAAAPAAVPANAAAPAAAPAPAVPAAAPAAAVPAAAPASQPGNTSGNTSGSKSGSTSGKTQPNTSPNPKMGNLPTGQISGKSTFYGGNLSGGACSFTGTTLPAGVDGTAYSGQVWNSGGRCGGCLNVKGPNGKTVKVMIVDRCNECDEPHLDLFQTAFGQIGDISAGIIPTSYEWVSCGISEPIKLRNKSGTSPYWFSMQVLNHNVPVSKLEVSTNGGGSWTATTRQDYNYFEYPSGFKTQTVDVRVTSVSGETIVVKNVGVGSGTQYTGPSNFKA